MKNNTLRYRVEQLEKNYCRLDGKIDDLLTNHLPHLEAKMASLETKISLLSLLNIGAIVIGLLFSKMI